MNRAPGDRSRPTDYLEAPTRRLHVFVPALMSVGFAFWLGALGRDYLRRHGDAKLERRARVAGPVVAEFTRSGLAANAPAEGLRSRRTYVLWSVPFLALATYIVFAATHNYAEPGGGVAEIGWLLAFSLVLAVAIAMVGGTLLAVGLLGPRQTPQTWRLAAATALGAAPDGDGESAGPESRLTVALVASVLGAVVLGLVVSLTGVLENFDERVSERLARLDWLGPVEALDPLGSSLLTIVAAALLGLASFRCRPLLIVYPTVVVVGLIANNVGSALVERERPPGGAAIASLDSFPSGHMIQLTLILGLMPLTLQVLTRRTLRFRLEAAVSAVVVALSGIHRVRIGAHWPTDVVAGVLIGGALVLLAYWIIGHESWHRRCHHCPWGIGDEGAPVPLRGAVPVAFGTARLFRLFAHLSAFAATVLLAVLARSRGIPVDPDGIFLDEEIQRSVQLTLAGFVSIGAVVSWKSEAIGASMLALAATGLGVFAAVQYEPLTAFAITFVVLAPAVLLWLSWQHRRSAGEIVALAGVTIALMAVSWVGIREVHAAILGPTHPDSLAVLAPIDRVEWVWSGGLGADRITVVARVEPGHESARLLLSGADLAGESIETTPTAVVDDLVRFEVDGLSAGHEYDYRVEVDGKVDDGRGRGGFRTPELGPTSFRFAAGSCSRSGTNGRVFDAIASEDPLFMLDLGDLFYANIDRADRGLFDQAFDRLLDAPGPASLFSEVPISYVWDDHDYGSNDADASSPTQEVARQAFRDIVPSHELAVPDDGPIHRAYTVGRVRFVISDTRSARTDSTMLGDDQRRWLVEELVSASETHALVIWANPTPWISDADPSSDYWGGQAAERELIADEIVAAGIDNLLMISGDAHMLAFDDGTHSGYQQSGGPGFPVLHAAALDRPGTVKGGPYTSETFPDGGQYGLIDIEDDGETIVVRIQGKTWDGDVLIDETLDFGPRA